MSDCCGPNLVLCPLDSESLEDRSAPALWAWQWHRCHQVILLSRIHVLNGDIKTILWLRKEPLSRRRGQCYSFPTKMGAEKRSCQMVLTGEERTLESRARVPNMSSLTQHCAGGSPVQSLVFLQLHAGKMSSQCEEVAWTLDAPCAGSREGSYLHHCCCTPSCGSFEVAKKLRRSRTDRRL